MLMHPRHCKEHFLQMHQEIKRHCKKRPERFFAKDQQRSALRSIRQMIGPYICLFLGLCFANPLFATGSGFFWGLSLGPANNNGSNQQAQLANSNNTTTVSPKAQQFGYRLFLGYMPSQYAGFELGATFFSSIKYVPHQNQTLCGSAEARLRDFELLVKGDYPFHQSFSLSGKAGAAFTYQTEGGALDPSSTGTCGHSTYLSKAVPAFALGLSYDLTQNWVTELGIHDVEAGGKIGRMTMYAISLSYHFVDRYCGQFLC